MRNVREFFNWLLSRLGLTRGEAEPSLPDYVPKSLTEFKLPVIEGKTSTYPDEPVCPVCKEAKVFEPHSFAFISGGALLMDRKEDCGGSSPDMDAYFTIGWHGAHSEGGDVNDDPEQYSSIDIVHEVVGGQFGLYFCSIKCLRFFLNACIDKLGD